MFPVWIYRKPIFVCSFRYTSSILTRNMAMSRETASNNPIERGITEKLRSNLNPIHLKVVNESHLHNVPKGSETHFKVTIVSDKFEDTSLLQRHRMITAVLGGDIKKAIHSLTVVAKTSAEWNASDTVNPSPQRLGGKK